MNRKSLTPLALALVIYNLNIPTAVGYDDFTESNKAYSFILGFGEETPQKCVELNDSNKKTSAQRCQKSGFIYRFKRQLFVFDNNRIHSASDWQNPTRFTRSCLTQGSGGVEMKPCVDGDPNQKISIVPFSLAYDYFKIVFDGGLCLTQNSTNNTFELNACNSSYESKQKFTPTIITEMIPINVFNNNRQNKYVEIITKDLFSAIVQKIYLPPISPGKRVSTSVLDFKSYFFGKSTTQINANGGTQYFESKNVRSGDTVEVTILPRSEGVSIKKKAVNVPEFIRDDRGSMLISTDQPEMGFYSVIPSAIAIPSNKGWLLRVYSSRFFQGDSYLKHDTNYLIERDQNAGSIKVLQTGDPNRTIRFRAMTDPAIEMDYIAFKTSKSNAIQ